MQGVVFEVRVVLRCFVGESVFFVGPSAKVNISAAFAAKRTICVGSFVTAMATALGASNDANLRRRHGLHAKRHFKWHIVGAVLQATVAVLTHHAHPNHESVAADFRNMSQARVNGDAHELKLALR